LLIVRISQPSKNRASLPIRGTGLRHAFEETKRRQSVTLSLHRMMYVRIGFPKFTDEVMISAGFWPARRRRKRHQHAAQRRS
jgi:hypothetical protein